MLSVFITFMPSLLQSSLSFSSKDQIGALPRDSDSAKYGVSSSSEHVSSAFDL